LRDLTAAGVVERIEATPPVATPRFRLTAWGRGLQPAVEALAVWATPRVAAATGSEEFRSRWLVIPAASLLHDAEPTAGVATIEIRTGDEPVTVRVGDGRVRAAVGTGDAEPDLVMSGPPRSILGVLAGALDPTQAAAAGVACQGDHALLGRVVPGPPVPTG
jgi:hypothetical protein